MTTAPSTILVPVDFGDASGRAVAVAGALAERCGAALRLLHAETIEAPAYFTPRTDRRAQARAAPRCGRRPKRFLVPLRPPAHVASVHRGHRRAAAGRRDPADDADAADLVVMGTHGRRGPSRWWLGSVAERVLRDDAPAAADRPRGRADRTPTDVFQRVLVHASAPLVGDRRARSTRAHAGRLLRRRRSSTNATSRSQPRSPARRPHCWSWRRRSPRERRLAVERRRAARPLLPPSRCSSSLNRSRGSPRNS